MLTKYLMIIHMTTRCIKARRVWLSCSYRVAMRRHYLRLLKEDVSQVLMCYSPRVSLQPTTPKVIEWHHDSPDRALSSLSRDRHRSPWPDPTRQATVPVPRRALCG